MNYERLQAEQRNSKKMIKVGMTSTFSGGIGLAIFLLQKLFSGIAPDAGINKIIDGACLILIGYAAAILVTYIFRRAWLLRVNMILLYGVIPILLIRLIAPLI